LRTSPRLISRWVGHHKNFEDTVTPQCQSMMR
jgi:hypothetical protein